MTRFTTTVPVVGEVLDVMRLRVVSLPAAANLAALARCTRKRMVAFVGCRRLRPYRIPGSSESRDLVVPSTGAAVSAIPRNRLGAAPME